MGNREEWREWKLGGLQVTQLRFDAGFTVHLWSLERDLLVQFGSPVAFGLVEGRTLTLDPEQGMTLCPLLSLLFRPASVFRASSEGRCELCFMDGTKLGCDPDDLYESWESHGSGDLSGASLLCAPGGGSPGGGVYGKHSV